MFATIAVSVQALRITGKPTEYVAAGKLVCGVNFSNNNNGNRIAFSQVSMPSDFYGTQIEIIEGYEVRLRALERIRSLHPELNETAVAVRATKNKDSTILSIKAKGFDPKYTRLYLDSLLDEYINYFRDDRCFKPPSDVGKVFEEVLTRERQVKECLTALDTFEQQNDPLLLSKEHERLSKEVSITRGELEVEKRSNPHEGKAVAIEKRLFDVEKYNSLIWGKTSQHLLLKNKLEAAQRDYESWKQLMMRVNIFSKKEENILILERPTAAVPEEPQLWLPLFVWGVIGAAAGVLVIFIAAFALTRLSKNPAASPPPLN